MTDSNGRKSNITRIPSLYTTTVTADRESTFTPSEVIENGLTWQTADYV